MLRITTGHNAQKRAAKPAAALARPAVLRAASRVRRLWGIIPSRLPKLPVNISIFTLRAALLSLAGAPVMGVMGLVGIVRSDDVSFGHRLGLIPRGKEH